MKKLIISTLIFFSVMAVFGQEKAGISGSVEWDTLRINAAVSLNMAQAGLKIPAGRNQGESLLTSNYLRLIEPCIFGLQVDSSTTIEDLVKSGELTFSQIETISRKAISTPPALSPDMKNITTSVIIPISYISSMLLSHKRASPVLKTLIPVSTARHTGIVIIALDELPIYGMNSAAMPVPCLFPKIWDTEMNLIYDRNMLEPQFEGTIVRYTTAQNIFQKNPSGLSEELQKVVGDRPLRIFAQGVFGINPTDLIIERSDALSIISSEENRRLLSQGKVVFVFDESVLSYKFSGE